MKEYIKSFILGASGGLVGGITLHKLGSEVTLYNVSLCAVIGICIVYSVYKAVQE